MATLDVRIDPSAARRGAAGIFDALGDISDAAEGAALAGLNLGKSFGLALGGVQAALALLGGPIRGLILGVGLLVGRLAIGQTLNDWTALSGAMGDLAAITGAVGADLEFLTTQARDFGAASIFASEEAARALTLVASARPALLENFQGLAQVTDDVLLLSRAAGIDLALAASIAGGAMNQFQIAASNSANVVNVLAAGAKFGSSEIAATADALAEAGVVALRANVSFEELNAAIQLLAAGGVVGGRAGTALKNVILGLQLGVEQFNPSALGLVAAIEAVGEASLNTNEQLQLVGREGITALQILTGAGDEFGALTQRVTGTNTALEQAEARFDNLAGDLLELEASSNALSESIGQYFQGVKRFYVQLKTLVVDLLNDFVRLDSSLLSRTSIRAEQLIGPAPDLDTSLFSQAGDVLAEAGQAVTGAFRFLSESVDDARLAAERLTVTGLNYWDENFARLRAFIAERRGEESLAERIVAQAVEEVDHRNAVLEAQLAIARAIRLQDRGELGGGPGTEEADARLVAINREIEAERERQRLRQERQDTIGRALDPLQQVTGATLEEQLELSARHLEAMRTSAEQLAIDIARVEVLGEVGAFAPDPQENQRRTQQAVAFLQQQFDQEEQARAEAAQRAIEQEERAAQRRLDILQRELEQRQAIADQLIDQYAPLIALDDRRADAIQRANTAVEQGLLSNDKLSRVLAGINEQYATERDRLTGVTAAMRNRQSVIDRYLRDRSALQRYQQALRDINAANLNSVDAERAKAAALQEYRAVLDSLEEPQRRLIEQQRRIAEEGQRQFEEFSSSVSQALASFLTGTEDALTSFLQNIAQQVLQAQLQATVVNPIVSALSGAFGGFFGGGQAVTGTVAAAPVARQFGGRTSPGRNYIVGERGPELLSQGAGGGVVTPLPQSALGGGGGVQLNVNNFGAPDNVNVRTSTGPSGEQVVDITVADSLRRQSGTGELDRTMGFYGGRRGLIPAG